MSQHKRSCRFIIIDLPRYRNASAASADNYWTTLCGRAPDQTWWKRQPGRPRAKWTDQLRRDSDNVPTATLWRQAVGRGHSRVTLRSVSTTTTTLCGRHGDLYCTAEWSGGRWRGRSCRRAMLEQCHNAHAFATRLRGFRTAIDSPTYDVFTR